MAQFEGTIVLPLAVLVQTHSVSEVTIKKLQEMDK